MTDVRKRLSHDERVRRVLAAADELFYARGVHEVGMDELVAATGLGKATVYRLFPTKDALIAAYLERRRAAILEAIDRSADAARSPRHAMQAVLAAIEADLRRAGFRGCAFNNASIEFADPQHPVRRIAAGYRRDLAARLMALARRVTNDYRTGTRLGQQLAVLIDGAYTSAAHLGPDGPAAAGLVLARRLVKEAAT